MVAKFNVVLAAGLLASSCYGGILGQAPSTVEISPVFDAITGPGYLQAVATNGSIEDNNVWITNLTVIQSNAPVVLNFTIAGGSDGVPYDVFATSALVSPATNGCWTWMGQGYTGVTYTMPSLTDGDNYLVLGTPQDSDDDGLTDAYEELVSHSNPYESNSIHSSMLDGWAVLWTLDPFAIYDQQTYTNAPQVRLGYWQFNTNTYQNDAGVQPVTSEFVSLAPDWSGTAVCVSNLQSWLSYPSYGPGGPTFDASNGTLRFWFMPFYDPGITNGTQFFGTFFDYGSGLNTWTLIMLNNELHLALGAETGPYYNPFFLPQNTVFRLQSNIWYQLTVTYSPSNVAIYTNGSLYITSDLPPTTNGVNDFALGNGIIYSPTAASVAAGFSFGNNNGYDASVPVDGLLDEWETFNYPLTPQAIAAGFPCFGGATNDIMIDSDYDGRSDMLELLVDGTDPNDPASVVPCRLGYWRFDSVSLIAEQGQIPLSSHDISLVPSWSGTALNITSDPTSQVTYWDVFTNGWANINCRQGSLRFWFKPNWSSPPANPAPLIYMGNPDPAASSWALSVNSSGAITFSTASNHAGATLLTSPPLPFDPGHWMQVVFDYGPSGTALYTNGTLAATGNPVTNWPSLPDRNLGMVIGNNAALHSLDQRAI